MTAMRLGVLFVLALCVSFAHALDDVARLRERLETVTSATDVSEIDGTLQQAQRALDQAERLARIGDEATRARALRIADAALTLCERKVARARARASLRERQTQLRAATRRLDAERAALAHAERLRREGGSAPSSPAVAPPAAEALEPAEGAADE